MTRGGTKRESTCWVGAGVLREGGWKRWGEGHWRARRSKIKEWGSTPLQILKSHLPELFWSLYRNNLLNIFVLHILWTDGGVGTLLTIEKNWIQFTSPASILDWVLQGFFTKCLLSRIRTIATPFTLMHPYDFCVDLIISSKLIYRRHTD